LTLEVAEDMCVSQGLPEELDSGCVEKCSIKTTTPAPAQRCVGVGPGVESGADRWSPATASEVPGEAGDLAPRGARPLLRFYATATRVAGASALSASAPVGAGSGF